ncbi:hypothetical protein LDENG_00283400 [Lucifuga dentata]|nr:hypothetical protein LDENG_00283400 [Lucifuga dentata]
MSGSTATFQNPDQSAQAPHRVVSAHQFSLRFIQMNVQTDTLRTVFLNFLMTQLSSVYCTRT